MVYTAEVVFTDPKTTATLCLLGHYLSKHSMNEEGFVSQSFKYLK